MNYCVKLLYNSERFRYKSIPATSFIIEDNITSEIKVNTFQLFRIVHSIVGGVDSCSAPLFINMTQED